MAGLGSVLRTLGAVALLGAVTVAAHAETEIIPLDAARSHAEFEVRAMWLFVVRGRFGAVQGEVRIDRAARSARVVAEIDAAAVRMHSTSHEAWVRSEEFFDVARHPRIRFVSEPFPLVALDEGGDVPGVLDLRGHSEPVAFHLDRAACAKRGGHDCPVHAEGSVLRSAFGMRSRRTTLADRVRLHFTIYASPSVTVGPPNPLTGQG